MLGLDPARGDTLSLGEYKRDFQQRQWKISGQDSWKLERQQHFQEPGFESWEAFSRGEWGRSLRLIDEERTFLRDFFRTAAEKSIDLFRVRVVEEPMTPYLQWELHLLRLRHECGEKIRVVTPEATKHREEKETLPELLTLGSETVYVILYTAHGVLDGAVRFQDPEIVENCRRIMKNLYAEGEELPSYFEHKVANLPSPRLE